MIKLHFKVETFCFSIGFVKNMEQATVCDQCLYQDEVLYIVGGSTLLVECCLKLLLSCHLLKYCTLPSETK